MNIERRNSLDKVDLLNWRWEPFLNEVITSLSVFSLQPYPIPVEYLNKEDSIGTKINPKTVKTSTWACKTNKIRQARASCIKAGTNISVLNLVISPFHTYDLPFFGIDFVSLPSGHLLAMDLQPALKNDPIHTKDVWSRLIPLHSHWQSLLPDGGDIPQEAKSFFSPGFLWTRLPLSQGSDQLIQDIVWPAFKSYLNLYIDLLIGAKQISNLRASNVLDGQKSYMNYRAYKDPARKMLTSFYGKEWTEQYIHKVLFDLE